MPPTSMFAFLALFSALFVVGLADFEGESLSTAIRQRACRKKCRGKRSQAYSDCAPKWKYPTCGVVKGCKITKWKKGKKKVRKGWKCKPVGPQPDFYLSKNNITNGISNVVVSFDWNTPDDIDISGDLDSSIEFAEEANGWECSNEFDAIYSTFSGDDNTNEGVEFYNLNATLLNKNEKSTSFKATLFAAWHGSKPDVEYQKVNISVYSEYKVENDDEEEEDSRVGSGKTFSCDLTSEQASFADDQCVNKPGNKIGTVEFNLVDKSDKAPVYIEFVDSANCKEVEV